MSQENLLKQVVATLEAAQIPYMATGSVVSSAQGEPRSTHDIDVVVVLKRNQIDRLKDSFPSPDFYLDAMAVAAAIDRNDMFNLLDVNGGDKVDFWMLAGHPFDQSSFSRRYAETIAGISVFVSRPEDTILQKLRWSALSGGSERQLRDALRVYEVQHQGLDQSYLDRWADELGVHDDLDRLRSEAVVL